jgi:hypothetical protein
LKLGCKVPVGSTKHLVERRMGDFKKRKRFCVGAFIVREKGGHIPRAYSLRMLDSRRVSDNVSGLVERQNVEMPEGVRQRVGLVKKRVGPNGRKRSFGRAN